MRLMPRLSRGTLVLTLVVRVAFVSPCPVRASDDGGTRTPAEEYVCGPLLADSARLLVSMLDPWTGLPYDQLACGGPCAAGPAAMNPAAGVVPQLAYATQWTFAEDGTRPNTVEWSFVDQGPAGDDPRLLFALRVALHLSAPGAGPRENRFGGLVWGANADVRRYRAVRIRYSTSSPSAVWELKLNFGHGARVEPWVLLPGTAPGEWAEARFELASSFPTPGGPGSTFLDYLVLAANSERGETDPVLWVDQIAFEADPQQAASCEALCPGAEGDYDLACHEPMTGAVNIANALSVLSLLPEAGRLDLGEAEARVAQILATVESFPAGAGGRWMQDWHSTASGMPDPRNHVASLTDQPQLYSALMVVEETWPALRARAAALRARMDFTLLYDGSAGCPGTLYGAFDRCAGVDRDWKVRNFGTESLLGAFLAEATGAAPRCLWTEGLAAEGCTLDGPADRPWYTTGRYCTNDAIPGSDTGGPFLQLSPLVYLSPEALPLRPLSLGHSARNMLLAQSDFADASGLSLAGWANASSPDACGYDTCLAFTPSKVTPYVWLMGLELLGERAAERAFAFHLAGADVPLSTGTRTHAFGLRDAWNQSSGTGRDAYLYLDTGWSALGILNYCGGHLVRQRFGGHPVAKSGYMALRGGRPACTARR